MQKDFETNIDGEKSKLFYLNNAKQKVLSAKAYKKETNDIGLDIDWKHVYERKFKKTI